MCPNTKNLFIKVFEIQDHYNSDCVLRGNYAVRLARLQLDNDDAERQR